MGPNPGSGRRGRGHGAAYRGLGEPVPFRRVRAESLEDIGARVPVKFVADRTAEADLLVGAAGFITIDPTGPFSQFTALPIQIFQWTSFPQFEWQNIAAAASLALLIMLLLLNAVAVILYEAWRQQGFRGAAGNSS